MARLSPPFSRETVRRQKHEQEYLEACTIITFMVSMWYFFMAVFKLGEPLAMLVSTSVLVGFPNRCVLS